MNLDSQGRQTWAPRHLLLFYRPRSWGWQTRPEKAKANLACLLMSMFCFWDCQRNKTGEQGGWQEQHSGLTLLCSSPTGRKTTQTSHSNTAKPFTQHLPLMLSTIHAWAELKRICPGWGSQHHEKLYWVFASETKCLRAQPINQNGDYIAGYSIFDSPIRSTSLRTSLCYSSLWPQGLAHRRRPAVAEWMDDSITQLSSEYWLHTQVTINGQGRWKKISKTRVPCPIKLRHVPSYSYQRGNAGWSTVAHELRPQSQCH